MLCDPPTTIIGLLHLALRIPLCHSLKEKRSALRPCIQHLRSEFNLAVAEVGDQDVWRSAVLAVVTVSNDKALVENTLEKVRRYFDSRSHLEIVELRTEIL